MKTVSMYVAIILIISLKLINCEEWAVLVAGSNGWYNYRHQADVAYAYHVLVSKGIQKNNIITMMYDDVAHDSRNIFKGKLFSTYEHIDHYAGLNIDYRESEVTPKMFMEVLKGNKTLKAQGKKVLESGPDDDVFIFFSDHGAPKLIAFPEELLYADQLMRTLRYMHENQRYRKLLFYLEACESGSMFSNLLPNEWNIFATTAANTHESSYACNCQDPDLDVCLADEYSLQWIMDSEKHNLKHRTIQEQFSFVRNHVPDSHVSEFGETDMEPLDLNEFQGDKPGLEVMNQQKSAKVEHKISSKKAHLIPLYRKMLSAEDEKERELAKLHLEHHLHMDHAVQSVFKYIINKITNFGKRHQLPSSISTNDIFECYRTAVDTFSKQCFKMQKVPEVSNHIGKFYTACENGVRAMDIVNAINDVC